MKPHDRDKSIIEHIITYCNQIEETVSRFGDSYEVFSTDGIYRNAVALCIVQIGELVGLLSDELKKQHADIPWQQIKATRNIVVHHYGSVDSEVTWEIVKEDIPALKSKCTNIIKEL